MRQRCQTCAWEQVPPSCWGCRFQPLSDPDIPTPDKTKKPPLGIKPREMHNELRLREVRAAIARYMLDGWPINPDWVAEYNHLIEQHQRELEKCGVTFEPLK